MTRRSGNFSTRAQDKILFVSLKRVYFSLKKHEVVFSPAFHRTVVPSTIPWFRAKVTFVFNTKEQSETGLV